MCKKKITQLTLAVFIFFRSSSAMPNCNQTDKEHKVSPIINIGFSYFPNSVDPIEGWHYQYYLLVQSIYSTLVRINEDGQIVSALAERWEVFDHGKHYRFFLRANAVFQNATPITSHDVAFSFARHLWPDSNSVVKERLASIIEGAAHVDKNQIPSGIKIIDNRTIDFFLKGPYPPFLRLIAMPTFSIVPEHTSSNAIVGSGPMLASFESNPPSWHLNKYNGFYKKSLSVDGFNIYPFTSTEEALQKVKNGTWDLILGSDIKTLLNTPLSQNIKITTTQSLAFAHLFFNNGKSIFKNSDLRRDIAYSLNGIAKTYTNLNPFVQYEPYFLPKGIMPPEYYQRNIPTISSSHIRDTWQRKFNGQALTVVLRKEFFDDEFGNKLIQKLKEFGFKVNLRYISPLEMSSYVEKGNYDIISGTYLASFPDPDAFIDSINNVKGTYHYGNIPTQDLMRKISAIQHTENSIQRLKAYAAILKPFEEEWFFVPLFRVQVPYVHNKNVVIPDSSFRYEAELWNIKCESPNEVH